MEKILPDLRGLMSKFVVYGDFLVGVPFGHGNVNDTYQVTYDQGGIRLHYILQRINHRVFKDPEKLMDNVTRVTTHILSKIRADKKEGKRRTLRWLHTPEGKSFIKDDRGNYWRAYVFVERARAYEILETPEQAYKVAAAFGEFQKQLSDLPGDRLHETIPGFHDTPRYFEALKRAIKADIAGRASKVSAEIDFLMERIDETRTLVRLNESGDIPERVTHNDTKANNILIDDLSGEGVCVLDLDTVMPGLSLYDFGDMVRSGANFAEEDEQNLDKVGMRFDMYKAFCEGYLYSAGDVMTEAEREMMPFAGKLLTMELASRFLTDYLSGDTYFKVRRTAQNLDRTRTQIKLVQSMESQFSQMVALIKK
jgi:thiamine kinase-like enzyme